MIDDNKVNELLAIQKLQNYVEGCSNIERAKKICKAFLEKYDPPTPTPVENVDPWGPWGPTPSDIPYSKKINYNNMKTFDYKQMIDPHLIKTTNNYKEECRVRGLNALIMDVYHKGFVTENTEYNYNAQHDSYILTQRVGVFKL